MAYDPSFLGGDLPLPVSETNPALTVVLGYTHFSVGFNRTRRLAEFTTVNIDGSALVEVERSDDWFLDDRLPEDEQAGPDLYARNDLDRGHLVRRRDPVWGDDAERANRDTFCYTNAAPQVNVFNQSKELWLGLEDYVLDNARTTDRRLTVVTGPVFSSDDPVYRGVQIPARFFKVAAWSEGGPDGGGLAATAYLLDQGDLLDALDLSSDSPRAAAELGAYRTFQVAVAEVADAAALDLGALVGADRLRVEGARAANPIELVSYDDIRL